ncbi:PREDICTED: transcription initiation factor TFIID subunit 11-like [Ipomoea nil]|uniref:transcription initiation factor TFIID subunit 11-like n=1 Tax=Ipomoea nil TaxID=35883 RepID=UPI000901171E|nr:PREDICTED: transcription initiation factor TFIID subunit 11-like [Ipomoea nil]
MAKLAPPPVSMLKSKLKKKSASSQGEEKKRGSSQKVSKKRKKRSKSFESLKKSPLPQEPIQAEQLNTSLTQEPTTMDKGAYESQALNDHLSLPQEPGLPDETRQVVTDPIISSTPAVETTLSQEPTQVEQMVSILTQEPVRIKSDLKESQPEPTILQEPDITENSRTVVHVPKAVPFPPSRDQLLPQSIENDFNRVMQWQKWRTSPLQTFLERFDEMKDEENFALEWIGTKDVYNALRLETINRVYSYKVTHRTLGNDKAPIFIELNKPSLDPAFEEEMKEFKYALLQSKVKTELERTHQNNPACDVCGSKDDEGKEVEDKDERTSAHERIEDGSDANGNNGDTENENNNEEVTENEETDEEDAENEENEDDDERKDDDDDDCDDDLDNNDDEGGNSDYDSESPILGDTEYTPERSPAPRSSPPKNNLSRDPSQSMPQPRQREVVEDPARDDNKDASPRDENMEASPQAQPFTFEHRSALRKPMRPYPDQELSIKYLSPEHIMHQVLNAFFNAELIHKQYLFHREKDSRNIADLSAKVDHLMQTMSHHPPSSSISDTQDKLAQELQQQHAILDKIAKEQHALKHTQFGLKE